MQDSSNFKMSLLEWRVKYVDPPKLSQEGSVSLPERKGCHLKWRGAACIRDVVLQGHWQRPIRFPGRPVRRPSPGSTAIRACGKFSLRKRSRPGKRRSQRGTTESIEILAILRSAHSDLLFPWELPIDWKPE